MSTSPPPPTLADVINAVESNHDKNFSKRLLGLYLWGSRVYGTHTTSSDYDFIAVVSHASNVYTSPDAWALYEYWSNETLNVTMFDTVTFSRMLYAHRLEILECVYLSQLPEGDPKRAECVYKDLDPPVPWQLELGHLRRAAMYEATKTHAKAKRMMKPEHDVAATRRKAKKELFHSVRYITFANQIATHGRIVDYSAANYVWDKVNAINPGETAPNDWGAFQEIADLFHKVVEQFFGVTSDKFKVIHYKDQPTGVVTTNADAGEIIRDSGLPLFECDVGCDNGGDACIQKLQQCLDQYTKNAFNPIDVIALFAAHYDLVLYSHPTLENVLFLKPWQPRNPHNLSPVMTPYEVVLNNVVDVTKRCLVLPPTPSRWVPATREVAITQLLQDGVVVEVVAEEGNNRIRVLSKGWSPESSAGATFPNDPLFAGAKSGAPRYTLHDGVPFSMFQYRGAVYVHDNHSPSATTMVSTLHSTSTPVPLYKEIRRLWKEKLSGARFPFPFRWAPMIICLIRHRLVVKITSDEMFAMINPESPLVTQSVLRHFSPRRFLVDPIQESMASRYSLCPWTEKGYWETTPSTNDDNNSLLCCISPEHTSIHFYNICGNISGVPTMNPSLEYDVTGTHVAKYTLSVTRWWEGGTMESHHHHHAVLCLVPFPTIYAAVVALMSQLRDIVLPSLSACVDKFRKKAPNASRELFMAKEISQQKKANVQTVLKWLEERKWGPTTREGVVTSLSSLADDYLVLQKLMKAWSE